MKDTQACLSEVHDEVYVNPYREQRYCSCGRPIARISTNDECQRCITREWEARFARGKRDSER
jgi:hypothetical protein